MDVDFNIKAKVEGKANVGCGDAGMESLGDLAWARIADMVRDCRDRGINDADAAKRIVRAYLNEVE